MKVMVYRRLRDSSEGKVKARCPISESQDHEASGHKRNDFSTFLGQIMSSIIVGKESGNDA